MDFNLWAAARTLKGKIGIARGFEIASRLNPALTEEEWRTAIADARQVLRNRANELSRNLAAKPKAGEINPFRVKNPGGYFQQVEVFVQDRDTGEIEARPFSYRTDTLKARFKVAKEVWDIFQKAIDEQPEQYRETILSVAYVGTHELLPRT